MPTATEAKSLSADELAEDWARVFARIYRAITAESPGISIEQASADAVRTADDIIRMTQVGK